MPVAILMMDNLKMFPSWLLLVLVFIQKPPELTAMPVGSDGSQLAQNQTLQPLTNADFGTCELDISSAAERYDEDCPNGATDLLPCNPGQMKVKECITTSDNLPRICSPCPRKSFQPKYNRCTRCHPCKVCGPNERIIQNCTDESDTVCQSITPSPAAPPTVTSPSPAPTTRATPAVSTPVPVETTPTNPISSTSPTTPSGERNVTYDGRVHPEHACNTSNGDQITIASVSSFCGILVILVILLIVALCYRKKGNGREGGGRDVNANNQELEAMRLVNGHHIRVIPDDPCDDQNCDQEECGLVVIEDVDGYANVQFGARDPASGYRRGADGDCPRGHGSGSPGHGAGDPDAAHAPDPASALADDDEPIYASVDKSRERGPCNSRSDVPAGHGPSSLAPPSSQRNRPRPRASASASSPHGASWKVRRPFKRKSHRKKDIPLRNLGTKNTENGSGDKSEPGEDEPFLPCSDLAGNAAGRASDPLNSPGPASGAPDLNGINPSHAPVTATTGGEGSETGAEYENLRSGGVPVGPHEGPEHDVSHEADPVDPPLGMPSAESNGVSEGASPSGGHDEGHPAIDLNRGPTTNPCHESAESEQSSASPSEDLGRSSCNDPADVTQNASCEVENDQTLPRQTRPPADVGQCLPPSEVDSHPDVPKQLPVGHRSANIAQNAVGGSDDAHLPTHQAPPPDGASTTADAKGASEVGRCDDSDRESERCGDSDRGESEMCGDSDRGENEMCGDSGRENEGATGKIGLDDAVSMKFLQHCAQETSCWDVKKVCRELEIEEHQIEDLEQSKPNVDERKFELLKRVKRDKGDRLTYRAVIDCLNKVGNTYAADKLIKDYGIKCATKL